MPHFLPFNVTASHLQKETKNACRHIHQRPGRRTAPTHGCGPRTGWACTRTVGRLVVFLVATLTTTWLAFLPMIIGAGRQGVHGRLLPAAGGHRRAQHHRLPAHRRS